MFKRHQPFPCISSYGLIILTGYGLLPSLSFAQDSVSNQKVLDKVVVSGLLKKNSFTSSIPTQELDRDALQKLNPQSIGDAAQYFSGVLVRDYGGVGGLKTISVRSLGASQTGMEYDGIMVADAQNGQIDLSKFSATSVQSLQLYDANPEQLLLPARNFSSSALLAVRTNTFYPVNFTQTKWQAGLKAGSFGYWQPFANIYLPNGKNRTISAHAEYTKSTGDYPYFIDNGSFSKTANRSNSDIQSAQAEVNFVNQFADSSLLQTKLWGYHSERGLPGSIIFFNDRSVQRLWDQDFFVQSRYQKKLTSKTSLLVSGKYSYLYTRYTDPDFLNNSGGIDDRYHQQEIYGSAALRHAIGQFVETSFASDIAYTVLDANTPNFVKPSRTSLWNNLAIQYKTSRWKFQASLLYSFVGDHTEKGASPGNKNVLTPFFLASFRPASESPFLLRAFYKYIFRMPNFNDLYYNQVGNISLRPEYTRQYDAGFTYSKKISPSLPQVSFSVDGYFNSVIDKIIAVPSKNLFTWSMLNLGKVEIKGIDLNAELTGRFSKEAGWFFRLAYTWQQALDVTDPSSATYNNRIPYTPDHSGSGLVSFNYQYWTIGYTALFSGKRYTLGENNAYNEMDPWITQDVYVTRLISLHSLQIQIRAEMDNLADERYDVVRYYPMPGRSYKLSLLFNNL